MSGLVSKLVKGKLISSPVLISDNLPASPRFRAVEHVFEFLDLVAEQRGFLFEGNRIIWYGFFMTATAVIEEIKQLPRAEQSRVSNLP